MEIPRIQVRKQSSRVVEPFNEFLKTLRKPAAQDIYTHLKTCVFSHWIIVRLVSLTKCRFQKTFVQEKVSHSTVDQLGEAVQEFYVVRILCSLIVWVYGCLVRTWLSACKLTPCFATWPRNSKRTWWMALKSTWWPMCTNSESIAASLTWSSVCVYSSVFSMASSDDEMKDLLLLRRIRMLSWLEPMHLDLPLNLESVEVQGLVSKGREGEWELLPWPRFRAMYNNTELWAMDSKKAPQDKLHCISKCSTYLMSALRHSQESPASADDFLPVLIFLLIHSSPQHLHSNIK